MGALLTSVIPLAIGAAISPGVLAITVIILGAKKSPRARVAYMLLGIFLVLAVIALVASSAAQVPKEQSHTYLVRWLDIGLGVLLLLLGIRGLLKKPDPNAPAKTAKPRGQGGPLRYIVVGFFVMGTDFSSLVLFIPGIRDTILAPVDLLGKIIAGAILFFGVMAPAIVPLLATIISPDRAGRTMTKINDWLTTHSRIISTTLAFVFGVYLVVKGLG